MSLFICTLEEIKREIGVPDSNDDTQLTEWLEGLQGRFEDFLDRPLLRTADITELHDGGERFLYLRRFPVESIASVHVDADQEWDAASLLAATDYRIDLPRGKLGYGVLGEQVWEPGVANVRVIYTGGYVAAGTSPGAGQTAMPEGLRGCFRLQAGFEWRNRKLLGTESASAQGFSVQSAPADFLPAVKTGLKIYRRFLT